MNRIKHVCAFLSFIIILSLAATSAAGISYTVRKGDTLRSISKIYKVSINELRKTNNLKTGKLKPGQQLVIKSKSHLPAEGIDAEKTGPAATVARLEEVKELSTSEDVLLELSIKERLILFAKKMLHLPYRFGGNGSFGLDCSAFVQRVYSFIGQDIPRSAREQFNLGEAVDKDDLTIGDLVFFKTYASFPSHVGIYLGNNLFIHASSLSKKVTINSLESPYYFRHFIGARRIIPEDDFDIGQGETSIRVN